MQTYSLVLIQQKQNHCRIQSSRKPCKMCLLLVKTALSVLMATKTSLAGGLTDYLQNNCEQSI